VLQAKDYAAFLLTGVFATDASDASLTQLLDMQRQEWAHDYLARLELPPEILPDIHPSATVIGEVTPSAAAQTGLRAGTRWSLVAVMVPVPRLAPAPSTRVMFTPTSVPLPGWRSQPPPRY
jgi:sugar (pentulose or hexulose) kinase